MVSTKYKPGDRVMCRWDGPGTIVKVAKVSAIVRIDGRDEGERIHLDTMRPETAEDVAAREHKAAMDAWHARKPAIKHARTTLPMSLAWYVEPDGAEVHPVRTPADMRAAAAELLLLADWFAERPVGQ